MRLKLGCDRLQSNLSLSFNLRPYNTDNSKSLDREEMLALLAEDNVMRARHTSSF